jgi:hypothetical protein
LWCLTSQYGNRIWIIDCVWLGLYANSFGGTKLRRNFILGYAIKKGSIPLH